MIAPSRLIVVASLVLAAAALPALAMPTLPDARAATERRDFASALPIYEALLARDPDNADPLIEAARVHGFAARNAAAAALYRRALAVAPGRRGDILPSLAWQTLWAGDAAAAQPWFEALVASGHALARGDALDGLAQARQALGDSPGALAAWAEAVAARPDDASLVRRYARALLWSDRPTEAVVALEDFLRRQPGHRDIAWALANARNFGGLHRQAIAEFSRLGAPVDASERADLARAWRWAGDPQRAASLLGDEARRDRDLGRELSRQQWARVEHAVDRDDLETLSLVAGAGWHPAPGLRAEVQARRLALSDALGNPTGLQLQGLLRWRLGSAVNPAGTAWPSLALRVQRLGDWTPVTGHARATRIPTTAGGSTPTCSASWSRRRWRSPTAFTSTARPSASTTAPTRAGR